MKQATFLTIIPFFVALSAAVPVSTNGVTLLRRATADEATVYIVDKRASADEATVYTVDKRASADEATVYTVDKRASADEATVYTVDK
ncbi:hypothetical protein F4677DRAFT_442973 [Hypoxylon crocopeplum]|nr:hypothetical protein F4677DRAFT_442973 [Hypoxylon crocopeplum]